jgi:hypothetical protein
MLKDGPRPCGQVGTGQTKKQHFQKNGDENTGDQQGQGAEAIVGQDSVINLEHHDRHGQGQQIDDRRRKNQVNNVHLELAGKDRGTTSRKKAKREKTTFLIRLLQAAT